MIAKKLGLEIRKRRLELGMTQQQLGDKVGVARCHVSWWETGRIAMTEANVYKVMEALEVQDVDVFLRP